jgi:hypothetical protein
MKVRIASLAIVLVSLSACRAFADWPADPSVPVTPFGSTNVAGVTCAPDGTGGVLVFGRTNLSQTPIQAQDLDALANPLWTGATLGSAGYLWFDVSSSALVTASGASGKAFALWPIDQDRLRAQRLGAGGVNEWGTDGRIVSGASRWLHAASLCADDSGGAFVAWMDQRTRGYGFFAQHLDGFGSIVWRDSGVALHQGASTETSFVQNFPGRLGPIPISDGVGGTYVVWCTSIGATLRILTQRILPDGTTAWGPNGTITFPNQINVADPVACADGAGGILVAGNGADTVIVRRVSSVQRFDRLGNRLWGFGTSVRPGPNAFFHPKVAADGSGGAFVAWYQDTTKVMIQHISPAGVLSWPTPKLLGTNFNSYEEIVCIPDGSGGAIVAWPANSPREIRAQRVAQDGSVLWAPSGVLVASGPSTPDPYKLSMVSDNSGGAYLAWISQRNPTLPSQLGCVRWVDGNGQLQPVGVGGGPTSPAMHLISYPNPTQQDVALSFSLPIDAPVQLAVYDLTGRRVCIAWSGTLARGSHTLRWDGADDAGKRSPQGLYFLRLRRGAETQTTRVMLLGR